MAKVILINFLKMLILAAILVALSYCVTGCGSSDSPDGIRNTFNIKYYNGGVLIGEWDISTPPKRTSTTMTYFYYEGKRIYIANNWIVTESIN